MFLALLCVQFVVRVLSEAPPAPPQNVQVDRWLVTWSPAAEDRDVTYTVQYRSYNIKKWRDVQGCFRTSANQCDVRKIKDDLDKDDCVMLRVRAERRGLNSDLVEACSTHGAMCTPEVGLTARPGYLTVHLSRNHSLAWEYGDHLSHRVYYGREGEPLEKFKDGISSLSIEGLQEGQRYCAQVQFLRFTDTMGVRSCPRCELIPSSSDSGKAAIIVPVVLVLLLVALTPVITYVLLFHCESFKRWLRSMRYEIPDSILFNWPVNPPVAIISHEEHTDDFSSVTEAN